MLEVLEPGRFDALRPTITKLGVFIGLAKSGMLPDGRSDSSDALGKVEPDRKSEAVCAARRLRKTFAGCVLRKKRLRD